ncbi:urease accessory protein UreF [Natronobeatus ordinarius]|uniref:urease accessory protein UreF n=1 Tax=Natronobeatus ordinarius TaxID=2963433 RepID=UPI0020CDC533|nr:urease accessory UreF family protein [Natronobeatus ordinarius]
MATDPASFLTALRLADSFLPVGTYTASYGIEQYVNEGRLEDADALCDLLEGYLRRIVGPVDVVALSNAHAASAAGDLEHLLATDERLHAVTLPAEFRRSATLAGEGLLALFDSVVGAAEPDTTDDGATLPAAYAAAVEAGETPGSYPVVLGLSTAAAGIPRTDACLLGAYTFVTETLGAAQRLGRFGHTEIQHVLSALLPVVEAVCDRYVDADLETMGSFAPLADVMGMRHERADVRLFTS